MKCPCCTNAELKAKDYETVGIQACASCGGIWLDQGKLKPILDSHKKDFSPALIQKTLREAHAGISKAETEKRFNCPKCAESMRPLNYDYSSGVILHVCPKGEGIWFAKDELEEVRIFMDHWDKEEHEKKRKWDALVATAETDELRKIAQIDLKARGHLGPVSSMIDSVFHEFEKLTRGR